MAFLERSFFLRAGDVGYATVNIPLPLIRIGLQDSVGNAVASHPGVVITATSDPPSALLSNAVQAVAGVAEFTSLTFTENTLPAPILIFTASTPSATDSLEVENFPLRTGMSFLNAKLCKNAKRPELTLGQHIDQNSRRLMPPPVPSTGSLPEFLFHLHERGSFSRWMDGGSVPAGPAESARS